MLADFNGTVLAGVQSKHGVTSSHGIGPMGTQVYVMVTISWRTMQEPNRTLPSALG